MSTITERCVALVTTMASVISTNSEMLLQEIEALEDRLDAEKKLGAIDRMERDLLLEKQEEDRRYIDRLEAQFGVLR